MLAGQCYVRNVSVPTVKDVAKRGKLLARFLIRFADCFARPAGQALLRVYAQGLLSNAQHRNAEAIAPEAKCCATDAAAPREGKKGSRIRPTAIGNIARL
jgi:hypothetical protein